MSDFEISLELKGIGPHKNTNLRKTVPSINMAIYAENGSGKSFISKSFKRISDYNNADIETPEIVQKLKSKSNSMIRFGENSGEMNFRIDHLNGNVSELKIVFNKDSIPIISDNTGLIYHVFNSEYVKENLETVNYKPEDKVSGFILGKINIDLTKEKDTLKKYKDDSDKKKLQIEKIIKAGLHELRELGIQTHTTEFARINFESVKEAKQIENTEKFYTLKCKYENFLKMPDNIEDIHIIANLNNEQIYQYIMQAFEILLTSYSLSDFAEEFKKEIKAKQSFIEEGLKISDGEKCPFCGQPYSSSSLALIDKYNLFLEDEEAKIIKEINQLITFFEKACNSFKSISLNNHNIISDYNTCKAYFPTFENIELENMDIELLNSQLLSISSFLEEKKKNIGNIAFDTKSLSNTIKKELDRLSTIISNNNEKISLLNNNKNNTNKERLTLRKSLCNAKFNNLIEETQVLFEEHQETFKVIKDLESEIEQKENQARIDRRKLLIDELKRYLSLFFADKYEFDEENFCIKFQNKALISNTEDVLSDGEKSILAFCFYMANIHGIVQTEEDYNKILFVIDDPVSSMDFNYVYNVAQVIRNIKKIEHVNRVRFIVLTHNMEFMSILVRNKIVKKKFVFSKGIFNDFKDNYVMPYTSNLIDLFNVSREVEEPRHTTPNSVRHILETIYHFEGTEGSLDDYISNNEILKKDGYLYSLINDHSHGTFRTSTGYTDDMIISSCKTVIEFIESKYPGQIKEIETIILSR